MDGEDPFEVANLFKFSWFGCLLVKVGLIDGGVWIYRRLAGKFGVCTGKPHDSSLIQTVDNHNSQGSWSENASNIFKQVIRFVSGKLGVLAFEGRPKRSHNFLPIGNTRCRTLTIPKTCPKILDTQKCLVSFWFLSPFPKPDCGHALQILQHTQQQS